MTLDELLKPITWIDEQVLRQYTKITQKWEDNGRSKYSLALMFSVSAWGVTHFLDTKGITNAYTTGIVPVLWGIDSGQNLVGIIAGQHEKGIKETNGKFIITDKIFYMFNKLSNLSRLPLFVVGSTFLAKGGVNLYNYITTNDQTSLSETIEDIAIGWQSFGVASSIYIKASDPTLLQKDPLWKKIYNVAKEKVQSLTPTPVPQPTPQRMYEL